MSYPPPPGASNSSSSLPPRPPPSRASGFKPAFSVAPAHTPSPASGNPYTPPAHSSGPSYPGSSAAQYGGGRGASYQSYPQQGSMNYQGYQQSSYPQQNYYGTSAPPDASTYAAAPQIRNPFPAPSQAPSSDYDPDMAAQIAQWQSAYTREPKDATAPPRPGAAPTTYAASAVTQADTAATESANADKKKTVVRAGGGQKWQDDTLMEWDPAHLRLFVGNLAGETTDESLHKAFSRWKSLQKARVVREKLSSKSKGFGFVSFSDPDDFFQAAKEMNGKYIQSHPVVVRKSTTEIKPQTVRDKHQGGKWNKNKNKNRGGNGNGRREGSYEPNLGATGGGVTKPGQKTKNGLKLLG